METTGDNPFEPPHSDESAELTGGNAPTGELALRHSRLMGRCQSSVLFVFIVMATFAIMSLSVFAYQATLRMPSGDLFRDTPLSWIHLLGHLVRGVGCAVMAVALWKFHSRVAAIVSTRPDHLAPALEALNKLWNIGAVYLGSLVLYGVVSQFWVLYSVGVLTDN